MGGRKNPPPSLLVQPLFSRVYFLLMLRRAAGGHQISHLNVGGSARWLSHHVDLDETPPAGSVLYTRDCTTCPTHFYWEFDFMPFFSGFLWVTHLRMTKMVKHHHHSRCRSTRGAQPSSSRRESTWIKQHRCCHLLSWFEIWVTTGLVVSH